MRRFLVPVLGYALLAALYLVQSGAPLRVHVLSLAVLALAVLVPGLWAARLQSLRSRLVVCAAFAMAAVLAWDVAAHYVVAKVGPFFMLLGTPWLYPVGVLLLASLGFLVAWVASPPGAQAGDTSRSA